MTALLKKVKANLVLTHNEDDALLTGYISAALDYAESYQKKPSGEYAGGENMPPSTEQAVVMLSSHFYESRDGSTGGFFADTAAAGARVWETVHTLLIKNKDWQV